VIENYIFYPPIAFAKQLLDAGEIGTPVNMRIKFISGSSGGWEVPNESWAWRMVENAEGRGMQTFDHGHHMWSLAWFFMGEIERSAPGLIRIMRLSIVQRPSCGSIKAEFSTGSVIIPMRMRCMCPRLLCE